MFVIAYIPGSARALTETFATRKEALKKLADFSPELGGTLYIVETDANGKAIKGK